MAGPFAMRSTVAGWITSDLLVGVTAGLVIWAGAGRSAAKTRRARLISAPGSRAAAHKALPTPHSHWSASGEDRILTRPTTIAAVPVPDPLPIAWFSHRSVFGSR